MKIVEKIAAVLLGTVLSTTVASAQSAKYVNANGLSFAYLEEGSGPPVVLVHGSVFDYREWSKQMKPLARHYRVIAYSRRYHWPNTQPGANVQFARGDKTNPNPSTTALIRAGDLADRATLFRNDLAFAVNPAFPKNPPHVPD